MSNALEFLRRYTGILVLFFFLLATGFIWSAVFAQEKVGVLTVAFLDVGQGDAIYIEAPNGNQMLIDGGPNASVLRELSQVMPFYDRSINTVVATHPDQDHINGLIDVLNRYEVGNYIESGVNHDSGSYNTLLETIENKKIPRTRARRGMQVVLDEHVYAEILFPDRDVSNVETNLGSVVLRLVYGETEFMLTGDSPKSIEEYLVRIDGAGLESDVLKAGHHGSKTSSAQNFVGFVNPQYAIISAGKDNRYGHPHVEVTDLFEQFDIVTLNTAEEGTIIFRSDGVRFFQK